MYKKFNVLLVFFVLFFSQIKGQENFIPISIDTDTVMRDWVKDYVYDDSLIVLEYQKIKYEEMPDIVDERIVYINLHKDALVENVANIKNQINKIVNEKTYLALDKLDTIEYQVNSFPETKNIYIPIYKLNDKYVVFLPDFDHPRVISDSSFMYNDDEGLLLYNFKKFSKDRKCYKIEYYDYQNKISEIEIKYYDRANHILVWKESFIGWNNKKIINYKLYIPLEEVIKYPVLNIINTGGLDDVYEKFDDLELNKTI